MKQKLFTFFFALVASVSAIYANEFTIGDLKYRIGVTKLAEDLTVATSFNKFKTQSIYGTQTWTCDSKYGAKMNGYVDKTYANEDWLVSPAIDLSNYRVAELTFSHAFGPKSSIPTTTAQKAQYTVWVSNDFNGDVTTATWTEIPISYGTSAWSYISTKVMIPAENLQKNCCIAWKYTCEDISATWEIKSVSIVVNEAEVIGNGGAPSSVQIPFEVTYEGDTYSVTSIRKGAFSGCSSLTSVTIPNSVTSIGEWAFEGCSSLTKTNYTGDIAGWCNIMFGNNIANPMCYSNNFYINDQEIKDLVIPNSVTSIGNYAFRGCSSLTSITCEAETPATLGNWVFSEVSKSIPVYVPCGCVEAYKAANGWKDFTNIQEPLAEYSLTVDVNDAIMGSAKVDKNTICDAAHISATPNVGYHFVQWSDGNTDAIRTLVLTQDTFLTAEFAQSFSGQCGDNLYWSYDETTKTISISGSGEMYDYTADSIPWLLFREQIVGLTTSNTVTSIGSYAFYKCSSLTSVTIGKSVTSIGNYAFQDCSSLNKTNYTGDIAGWCNIMFGNSYANPMYYSHNFYINDQEIKDLVIPNSVTNIGNYAFYKCSSLTSVTIPNSVTSIGEAAFGNCSSLTSITIPNSVTSIGDDAFRGCSSLTSIIIPNSVTNIGNYAFYKCSSLTSVTIGESVTSIGNYAFYKCSSLTSVTIGESVTSIGDFAFYECSSLTSITCEAETPATLGGNWVFSEVSKSIPVYVPCGCVKAYKAASGWKAFTNIQESLAEYSIEVYVNDTIMGTAKVDYNTFCEGNQISATPNFGYHFVQWSDGNTDAIRTLVLTQDTILIAKFAQSFSGRCGDSLYWELVDTTLHITGNGAMYNYTPDSVPWKVLVNSIKTLTVAEGVSSIGDNAFYGCSSLTSVTINSDAIVGNDYTWMYNLSYIFGSQVTEYIIGESVTSIGKSAFDGCSSLTSVTIPNSVTSIGKSAFDGCSRLKKTNYTGDIAGWCNIKFGNDGITCTANPMCYSHNFYINDKEIKDLVIPNSVDSIYDFAFYDCSSLNSVTIGDSVTSIGDKAFYYCSSLTSITIPDSVTSIGGEAFYGCSSLTSVTIGNSVTSIGWYAFSGCSSLTSITCEAVTPPTIGGTYTFDGVSKSIPVYVPCGCVKAYKAASGWKAFTNIQEPLAEYSITVDVNDTIMGTAKVDRNSACGNQISATPNIGYHFVQWSDGNTDAIRTLELTQDTILTAEFAQSFSGQCGDSLYWELVDTTLHITGKGEMYDYESNTAPWKLLVSSIKSLSVSEGTTSIGGAAFLDCSSLTSVTINSDAIMSKGYSSDSNLSHIFGSQVTEYIIGDSVTSIGDKAFYNCSSLTSVAIGESVTSIGIEAFKGCSKLTSMIIPNSVTSIGGGAFDCCSSLTSVTIPNGVTSIGDHTFAYCSLTSVTIPNSVTSIGDYAFWGCSSLTSITCEATTPPTIGTSAFASASKSIPVYVPCGCVKAYKAASRWKDFTNIREPLAKYSIEVYVNDTRMGTAKVNYNTFCEGNQISATPNFGYHFVQWSDGNTDAVRTLELTQDTILTAEFAQSFSGQCGDSLYWELVDTTLHITGKGEMYDYESNTIPWKLLVSSIKSLSLSERTTSIGDDAFYGCSSLTSVIIPNSVTSIGGSAFYGCSSLTSVTIPNGVTSIGEWAFEGCSSLTSVTIPNSVKTIGASAFDGCARLGKISLGTGLEEIAANAFASCTRLYDIYCHAVYPPFAKESSFANYNAYLYIPCDSKRDYTLDPVWGKFQHIECLETDVENVDTSSQQQTNCQKIIRNGQLLILRDGVEYTVMGQEL